MRFNIEPLTQSDAETIATWHYDGEYAFYDAEADPEDLEELLDPALRGDSMFGVRDGAGESGRVLSVPDRRVAWWITVWDFVRT